MQDQENIAGALPGRILLEQENIAVAGEYYWSRRLLLEQENIAEAEKYW